MAAQRSPRILHVSTAHPPFDSRIFDREACALARSGFRVDVAMNVTEPQERHGVTVRPLGSHGGSRLRRVGRNVRALKYMLGPYDIVHVHDPELLVAGLVATALRKKVVYDVHEFYRARLAERDPAQGWIHPALRPAVAAAYGAFENAALPRFAGAVVVAPEMADMYAKIFKRERIALVRNFPQIDAAEIARARAAQRPIGHRYFVQTGGASYLRCFGTLVEAAEQLGARGIYAPLAVLGKVDLSGYPASQREKLLQRAKRANVLLVGRVPHTEMLRWVAHAHGGIATQPYSENAAKGFATKIFEYFALGLPVIVSDFGNNAKIVRSHGAGIAVPYDDAIAYADAMENLLADAAHRKELAAAAGNAAKRYSFQADFPNLTALYRHILSGLPRKLAG